MPLHLKRILNRDQLSHLRELTALEPFANGASTATGTAARVKNNLQLSPDSEAVRTAGAFLVDCLRKDPLFELAVQPRDVVKPLFSRYEVGMSYGYHLDSPILNRDRMIRSDVSITVFLNARTDYDGGELIIDAGSETLALKGDAGDCVIYPSTAFHRVAEVSRGVRLVSALWAQSLIRDPGQREILFDLGCAIQFFDVTGGGKPYVERLRRSYTNLIRQWAEL
jgi:PKHD-type hydroxylase